MVIRTCHSAKQRGLVIAEIVLAITILTIAMLPLAFSAKSDARLFRATYQRAIAMEIVDGEIEILAAGEWRNFSEGSQPYSAQAKAAVNLPPGNFQLTRSGQHLRLEWISAKKQGIGPVVREVTVK